MISTSVISTSVNSTSVDVDPISLGLVVIIAGVSIAIDVYRAVYVHSDGDTCNGVVFVERVALHQTDPKRWLASTRV